MDEWTQRVGENEILFREVNHRLEGLNRTFGTLTETMRLVCECGDGACTDQIVMKPDEYRHVRSDSTQFAVIPGHEILDAEDVIARNERFNVVKKRPGGPAELAAQHAPHD